MQKVYWRGKMIGKIFGILCLISVIFGIALGNGTELARWESERVANVPAHIFFYMVSGGWANEPLDDDELPDDFTIDWFRVWQRDDLK